VTAPSRFRLVFNLCPSPGPRAGPQLSESQWRIQVGLESEFQWTSAAAATVTMPHDDKSLPGPVVTVRCLSPNRGRAVTVTVLAAAAAVTVARDSEPACQSRDSDPAPARARGPALPLMMIATPAAVMQVTVTVGPGPAAAGGKAD
jgi:hypothetical protein